MFSVFSSGAVFIMSCLDRKIKEKKTFFFSYKFVRLFFFFVSERKESGVILIPSSKIQEVFYEYNFTDERLMQILWQRR